MVNIEVLFEEIDISEDPEKKLSGVSQHKSSNQKSNDAKTEQKDRQQKICNYLYVGDNNYSQFRTSDDFKGSIVTELLPHINGNVGDIYFNYKDGVFCCGDNPIYETLNAFKDEDVMEIYTNRRNIVSSQNIASSIDLETLDEMAARSVCTLKDNMENALDMNVGVTVHSISCNIDELFQRTYGLDAYAAKDRTNLVKEMELNNNDKENDITQKSSTSENDINETQLLEFRSMSLIKEEEEGASSLVVSTASENRFRGAMVKAKKQEMNLIMSNSDYNADNSPNNLVDMFPDPDQEITETSGNVTNCTYRVETDDSAEECDYDYEDDFSLSITSSTENIKNKFSVFNDGCMMDGKINRKKYEDLFRKLKTNHSSLIEINSTLQGLISKHLQNNSENKNPVTYMQIDEYFAKLKNYEVLRNSIETRRKSIEEDFQCLTKILREKRAVQHQAFSDLLLREKEIGFDAVSSKTGKHLPKIVLEKLLHLQQIKMNELAKLRCQYIITRNHIQEKESVSNLSSVGSSTICGLNKLLDSCISSELEDQLGPEKHNKFLENAKAKAKITEEAAIVESDMRKCISELEGLLEEFKKAKQRVKNRKKKYSKICQNVNKCQEKSELVLKKGLFKDYYNAMGRTTELTAYLANIKRFYKDDEMKMKNMKKTLSKTFSTQYKNNNNIYDYSTSYIFKSARLRIDDCTLQEQSISSSSIENMQSGATSCSRHPARLDQERSDSTVIIALPSKHKLLPLCSRVHFNPKYNLVGTVTANTVTKRKGDAENKNNNL